MERDEAYIPEIVETDVATTSTKPADPSIALRRELAFHKTESARKDDILRRHGIPTQAVAVAPVAPLAVPSAALDPRAVAHEVLDSLGPELEELRKNQADILKQLQHAGGYEVSPAGNRVDRVGPPMATDHTAEPGTSAAKPGTSTDAGPGTGTHANPDDEMVYVPSSQTSKGRALTKSPARTMTRREAEEKGYTYRKAKPNETQH